MSPSADGRKVLCSLASGDHRKLLCVSEPTFRDYGARHGYEVLIGDRAPAQRPPAWAKVELLMELLERYELVVWIDADAVIVDPSRDIASALPAERQLGLVRHVRGRSLVPNTGVMVLRSGELTRRLMASLWRATHLLEHPWWDNAALAEALGYRLPGMLMPGLAGRLHRLAARALGGEPRPCRPVRRTEFAVATELLGNEWNSVDFDPAPRPRIVHFPGIAIPSRLVGMRAALQARDPAGR